MVNYLGSLVQLCCGEGRTLQKKKKYIYIYISLACVGSAHSVWAPLGLPPLTAWVLSQPTLLRLQGALQGAGPGLCALPRSKPLRFRSSGTRQRYRLGWACILCPSPVWAAQVTRCLASALFIGGECVLSPPRPSRSDSRVAAGMPISCAVCLFWGTDLWLQPSRRMSTVSFRRQWAAFLGAWCPLPAFRSCFVEFAQRSNVLSMNLWGRKWSPRPIPPPS